MRSGEIIIFTGSEISSLLAHRELEIIDLIQKAYQTHEEGDTTLPQSMFLRFPNDDTNRIIALPAYLGGNFNLAGFKWIASFPGNIQKGMDRASAITVLNSLNTGRPEFIFEGSLLSAKRTAASAVLAAKLLWNSEREATCGLIGCGVINFEVLRFLQPVFTRLERILVYDISPDRAAQFQWRCRETLGLHVEIASETDVLFRSCGLISLATTALHPHIHDLSYCAPDTVILHVSLRDLAPSVILNCENIVDDIDHVCRAQTSVHLAEQLAGHRKFITATLASLCHSEKQNLSSHKIKIFSPFGLGILDLALAGFVRDLGLASGAGITIPSFFLQPWGDSNQFIQNTPVCIAT